MDSSTVTLVIKVIATAVGLLAFLFIIFAALFMDRYEKEGLTITPHEAQRRRNVKTKRRKI